MRDALDGLSPSRNVARRMHELETELRQARTQLRRHNKSPETLGRWRLDTPVPEQQEEGWFITYLDMMTLLLVVMIVMLAFSGSIGAAKPDDAHVAESTAPTAAVQPASTAQAMGPALSADAEDAKPTASALASADVEVTGADVGVTGADPEPEQAGPGHGKVAGGTGLLPGGLGFLPGKSALGDSRVIPGDTVTAVAADVSPLPPDATAIYSVQAAVSLAELYPGWAAEDLSASFVGPPRPTEEPGPQTTHMASASSAPGSVPSADAADAASASRADPGLDDVPPSEGESLAAGLALADLGNDVEVVVNERSVSFRVNSEILFDSSQADLSRPGLSVLRNIVAVLADTDHDVTVEGHTDSVPVRRNVRYPSNWELSSSRAGSVVRYLQANGIDKTRLKAIGYADARPIDDNNTPDGRARNRRVELIIEKHD